MEVAAKDEASRIKELERRLQYQERLRSITNKIHSAKNINEIFIKLKDLILSLFNADRITIYSLDPVKNQLFSKYMVGSDIREIRVPIAPESLAGYSAFSLKLVNIPDVYNDAALKQIDPQLKFDSSWDQKSKYRTKQVLACPIIFENQLLGVIQLINKKSDKPFNKTDEASIREMARVLGIAFRNQSKMVHTRFDFLISQNVINDNELRRAMVIAREQKKEVETILMEDFKIKKKDILTSLSQFYGCKAIEFDKHVFVQRELWKGLSTSYMKKSNWLPLSMTNDVLTIVIDNPKDPKTAEIKSLIRAKEYDFTVALKEDIQMFLVEQVEEGAVGIGGEAGLGGESMNDLLAEMHEQEDGGLPKDDSGEVDENTSTIVRLVNQLIVAGYEKGASDIHIEPSKNKKITTIRFRVDGACAKHLEIPITYSQALASRIKIMSSLDISERRLPQDGKIKFKYKDKPIELRVATLPTVGGEDVVMRILASSEPIPLEKMSMSDWTYKNLMASIEKPYGIVLVVGPTGSGKTTTLHSCLGKINTIDRKIWTAEDPVEITQEGLRQVEVKPKIGFDFSRAMRAFLRADPDVIMVGEMRDLETASTGIEASLTGHLVFSTLHTNSAPETVTRLIDMGLDPFNFADALICVLAQRLARTLCKDCKEEYHPEKREFDEIVNIYGAEHFPELGYEYNDNFKLFRPKGCDKCNQTGYRGRTGIHELLVGTEDAKTIIAKKSTMDAIRTQAMQDGMRTLFQDGIRKVLLGVTDLIQIRRVCID